MRISDWSSDVCSSDLDFRKRVLVGLERVGDPAEQGGAGCIIGDAPLREGGLCPRKMLLDLRVGEGRMGRDRVAGRRIDARQHGKLLLDSSFAQRRAGARVSLTLLADRKSTRLNSSH